MVKTAFTALVIVTLLSGCGSAPKSPSTPSGTPAAPSSPSPPSISRAPATPAPSTKGGGYYLDDGPHEKPAVNPDSVPDAVPRVEPLNRATIRPYTVMGRSYTPMSTLGPYKARGVASWYGRRYHGKKTSSGEIYDMYGMTAAHPILPIPSYVRVTHLASGRTVVVRVNDRGPFIDSRLIDLSYSAAYKLGVLAGGSAQVEVELITPGAGDAAATAVEPSSPAPERTITTTIEPSGVFLQLATMGTRENAEAYAERLRGELFWMSATVAVYARDAVFRVQAGSFTNADEARQTADRISLALGLKPTIITK